jgi:GntR family transcriptional regulator/MocR family aminotransferase
MTPLLLLQSVTRAPIRNSTPRNARARAAAAESSSGKLGNRRGPASLYAGTFSKVLFPALRLGYLVVPDRLVDRFAEATSIFSAGCGRFEQAIVAAFMTEGHFARHLKRMRGLYAARRAVLAAALTEVFGDRLTVELGGGGMHLVVRPNNCISDAELVHVARSHGLALTLAALSDHTIAAKTEPGLLLSFTNVPEASALVACQILETAIGDRLRRS